MVTHVRRITSGCRVTIPKKIRDDLGIKSGDFVRFIQTGEVCLIEKVKASEMEQVRREIRKER
jgi:AbrB family looped-hinge helix DNA binding protein